MLFLKKIKNFWCCHKNIVVLWQNKGEWHKASIAIQRLTQNGEAELYRHPLKTLPMYSIRARYWRAGDEALVLWSMNASV